MLKGNPYTVIAHKARKRFRPEAVGCDFVEVVDKRTGEISSAVQLLGNHKLYDSSEFVKLYMPEILRELSPSAVLMFSYIATNLRFGGVVTIHLEEAETFTGKSKVTIWRGLRELAEKDIIRKRDRNEFWVNPNVIYMGQRDEFLIG